MYSNQPLKISKKDHDLIRELDQNIRIYVQKYGNSKDSELLDQAISDIHKHHENQIRTSGQPFINHPLRVANYICRAGLDAPTVVASLLHDIIEDTKMIHNDIHKRYGPWYAEIVTGLTKIKKQDDQKNIASDNLDATYERMLKAMVQDVRALFIKIFDRLDNMRDMEFMPRENNGESALKHLTFLCQLQKDWD